MNRVESGLYPSSIRQVVFQRGQFSCTSRGNFRVTRGSLQAAKDVMNGKRNLPKHVVYFNTRAVNPGNGHYYTTIGNHNFYYSKKLQTKKIKKKGK